MFVFDWLLGLLCLVPIVVSALCMAWMMAGGAKDENANAMTFMRNYQDALDRMNKAAVEYVRGIPVVKVFQQTVRSFSTFRESMVAYRDFATAYVKLCSPPQVAQLVAINCTFAVLVPAGILLARGAGDFSAFFTDFLFYVVFSALTTMMMTKVMYASQAMTEAQDAVSRIEDILGTLPMDEVDAGPGRGARRRGTPSTSTMCVSLSGRGAPALADVRASRCPRHHGGARGALGRRQDDGGLARAALLGRGAGRVLVGDVDVRAIPAAELMERVAFVFQNDGCSSRACRTTSGPHGPMRPAPRWRPPRTPPSATT